MYFFTNFSAANIEKNDALAGIDHTADDKPQQTATKHHTPHHDRIKLDQRRNQH